MKVLQIVKTSSGANWAFEQAKKLKDKGLEIVTVLPNINGSTAEKYKKYNMKLLESDFSLPTIKPWKIFKRINNIRDIIEKEKPDIIHMHFVTNVLMCRIALRGKNIPRIFQVPGPLHLEHFLYRKVEILLANKQDYWLPSCKKSRDIYLKEGIDKNRIFLAYYGGYGGKAVDEYIDNENILHKQLKIDKTETLVGMVSYFYKPKKYLLQSRGIKGHEDFIDAIAILIKEGFKVKGVIIGGPWKDSEKYEKRVKEYAKKICGENIIFTGFRTDLKKIYKELDIAVHPSHSENLGGAAESLAAGVPTIATNIGGFPDIVIDGKTGYLAEVCNPKSIANCIKKILADKEKAQNIAEEGQRKVRDLLDIEKTVNRIYEIYDSILKGNNYER